MTHIPPTPIYPSQSMLRCFGVCLPSANASSYDVLLTRQLLPSLWPTTPTMTSLCLLEEVPDCSQYTDWKELRQALDNWAVRDKFTYWTPSKDPRKARHVCANADYRWTCHASKQHDGMVELRVSRREHTCWTGGVAKFSSSASKD
jgi:ribosomal protein L31